MQGELKDTVRYMPLTDKLIDNISTHDITKYVYVAWLWWDLNEILSTIWGM